MTPAIHHSKGRRSVRVSDVCRSTQAHPAFPQRIKVVLPDPAMNVHSHAFDEIALALLAGLKRLHIDVTVTRNCEQGPETVLVLAPHLHPIDRLSSLRSDAIVFNWEPLGWSHRALMTDKLIEAVQNLTIWDYSLKNAVKWNELGARHVRHVPLAYDPVLERLDYQSKCHYEIDVLFYGSGSDRRRAILTALQDTGLKVTWLFGAYGKDRDVAIRRSRLVLNMHVHEGQILELARLSYLWANRVPVVCEINPESEDTLGMSDVALNAPYRHLVDYVVALCADQPKIAASVDACYERIRTVGRASEVLSQAWG